MKTGSEKMAGSSHKDQKFLSFLHEEEEKFRTKYPHGEGFKAPDGYFDSLSERLREQIANSENELAQRWYTLNRQTLKPVMIPLAIVAAMLIAVFLFLPEKKSDQQATNTDTLPPASIYDYDESYAREAIALEDASLSDAVENTDDDLGYILSMSAANDTTLSETDIIDYLNDQEIDPELLAEL
ncbi:MAG TPA: hypothetical protein PK796_05075 [Bacteroidales bacterium]|jgi:hypothetical protein|nr:hypothetical protein [Bacteroidales bacterium]